MNNHHQLIMQKYQKQYACRQREILFHAFEGCVIDSSPLLPWNWYLDGKLKLDFFRRTMLVASGSFELGEQFQGLFSLLIWACYFLTDCLFNIVVYSSFTFIIVHHFCSFPQTICCCICNSCPSLCCINHSFSL